MQRVYKYLNLSDPHGEWVFQYSMFPYMTIFQISERYALYKIHPNFSKIAKPITELLKRGKNMSGARLVMKLSSI